MSKNIRISLISAVMVLGLFIATSAIVRADDTPVSAGSNSDVVAVVAAPNAQGSNASGDPVIIPNGQGSNTSGDPSIIPNTGGSNGNEGTGIIPNGQGSNTDEPTVPVTPPANGGDNGDGGTTPPPGGGSSNTSGGTSSNVGGGTAFSSTGSTASLSSALAACTYLNDYLKIGGNNNAAEVTKLQTFLKNNQGLSVDINGTFDNKTFEAVQAFQGKYLADVMGPWGVTTPTGQVYYTTKKKINEIYCNSIFNLTAEQLAQIEAYRNGVANGTITGELNSTGTTTSSSTQEVGSNAGTNDNGVLTAAGANVAFTTKIWNFIKWLFGY